MTDFNRVRNYYKKFDEKNRLKNDSSGRLEFLMTMGILENYLPEIPAHDDISILDLGGAAGVYSFPLAKKGYKVTLADLSEELIALAEKQKKEETADNLVSCDVVNATDLSIYNENQFDVVLLFGPLYHLLENEERQKCISEIKRVLKPGGKVFASFIPYLSGSIALLTRFYWLPEQVNINTLCEVFKSGKFNNLSDAGFQEGYYPTTEEIEALFSENGFEKILLRSIRGFGYEKEDMLFKFENTENFGKILNLIDATATDKSIIDMCGHALYAGCKKLMC